VGFFGMLGIWCMVYGAGAVRGIVLALL